MDKTVEPITDDAELAKVLEGMQDATPTAAPSGLSFEPTVTPSAMPSEDTLPPAVAQPVTPPTPTPGDPAFTTTPVTMTPAVDSTLETIKKDALEHLRPLVDKLNLPPEEKFDTLLLLIRSTDDKALVATAYASAKDIPDEAKRAEALLDIIKEIDYFSNPGTVVPQ